MNVVVLNTVLSNTGDAAIFEAIDHTLRQGFPEHDFDVIAIDSAARHARALYPSWHILQQPTRSPRGRRVVRAVSSRIRVRTLRYLSSHKRARAALMRWKGNSEFVDALRAISAADIVVSSGGTYLVDHYDFDHRVAEIEFAHSLGKSVYLWTQSLGPFKSARARNAAERLLPLVEGVFFRDQRSADAWANVGEMPSTSNVCADAVFSLYEETESKETSLPDQPVALLSVREWDQPVDGGDFSFARYTNGMRELAIQLINAGWRCIAVSTCQGVDGYVIDDSRTAARIFSGLDVVIDSSFHTPTELMRVLRAADLVVATRMHMAILSLISRTPVIAVAYETKSLELFRSIGAENSVTPIEDVDEAWAQQLVSHSPTDSAARLSEERLAALSQSARTPADEVLRAVGSPS